MGLKDFIMAVNAFQATTTEPEQPPEPGPSLHAVYTTVSNKYVDIVFDQGVYADAGGVNPVTTANFSIVNLFAGGTTNVTVAAVKRNTHFTSASALNLIGGEDVIRVFITLTGTPTSVESFRIQCSNVFGPTGISSTFNTPLVKLNITPLLLWDATETAAVTTLGLGISQLTNVMGLANFTQSTDAQRPIDGGYFIGFNRTIPKHMTAGTSQGAFQKGNSFTVAVKRLKSNNVAETGYIISRRGGNANNQGWSVSVGSGNQLFFVLRTTAAQGFCQYDSFSPNAEINLFFINNNGTLNIRDSAGNALGTTGDATALGTITYTSIDMLIGRRMTETTENWTGYFEKIAIFDKALSADEIADVNENFG